MHRQRNNKRTIQVPQSDLSQSWRGAFANPSKLYPLILLKLGTYTLSIMPIIPHLRFYQMGRSKSSHIFTQQSLGIISARIP